MPKQFLIRSEELPVFEYGKYPGSRTDEELKKNGIVIVDKPEGPTSRAVTETVKEKLGAKKAGHSGTLDPAVTGVMIITLDNACKVIPALQVLDKEYEGVMHLHDYVTEEKLQSALKKFTGTIKQKPPVRSAVARKERLRKIYSLDILKTKDKDIEFRVSCEAGTYIRKLCHDIGQELGVGAHMAKLRRTRVGNFTLENSIKLHEIKKSAVRNFMLPVEAAVEHLGHVIVKDSAVANITNGSPLFTTGLSRIQQDIDKEDLIAVMSLKGELVALGTTKMSSQEMIKRRGFAVKIDRVVMQKGVYPPMK